MIAMLREWAILYPAAPPCLARDWLSAARCSLGAGHCGWHASEDEDFEIRWPRK